MSSKANLAAQTIEAVLNSMTVEMTSSERLGLEEAARYANLLYHQRDHWRARAHDLAARNSEQAREVLVLRTDNARLERELLDARTLCDLLRVSGDYEAPETVET